MNRLHRSLFALMAPITLKPLAPFAASPLLPLPSEVSKPAVSAGSLWTERPSVVVALRRPGCQLCRGPSAELYKLKPELDKLGVSLVAVVHEALPAEVADFKESFWQDAQLFLDQEKAFYKSLGEGSVRRGSLMTFLNPFSTVWKHAKASSNVKGNFVGDGLTFGGVLVVRKGGVVEYAFREDNFGDHPPAEVVLAAARSAAAASLRTL